MKNSLKKIAVTVLLLVFGVYSYGQEPMIPGKVNQGSPKDEFIKNLKDFQPKLDEISMRAKENAAKMPDFSREVGTLNDMVAAFKSKIDQFDQTPQAQQSSLVTSFRTDWASIQSQYKKASDLWTKSHPDDLHQK